jgi:lysophospholipase L1-like esterase
MDLARPPHFERYVALGDSSTQGIDDPDGAGGYRGWSQRLAERIAGAQGGLLYANFAERGLTTAQVRERQLAPALALRPDLATLFCGTNDVMQVRFDAQRVAADFEQMQHMLVTSGATVLSFTLPDLAPVMPLARLLRSRIAALNRGLILASRRTGAIIVDFAEHPVASDPRLWSEDRIHANAAGHARIAEALAQALRLPRSNGDWQQPLPARPEQSTWQWWAAEFRWVVRDLLPWMRQEYFRRAPGSGPGPKRPQLAPV